MWLPLLRSLLGTWLATQACALTGTRTGDPWIRGHVLNALSHSSQGLAGIFKEQGSRECVRSECRAWYRPGQPGLTYHVLLAQPVKLLELL